MSDTKTIAKLRLDIAQITAIGDRLSNQDALACASEDELSCFVLADGTGGHEGGEIAANLVTAGVMEKFKQEASFSARALKSYVDWAIIQVSKNQQKNKNLSNMSTTVATDAPAALRSPWPCPIVASPNELTSDTGCDLTAAVRRR